jgi:hypothetical protein
MQNFYLCYMVNILKLLLFFVYKYKYIKTVFKLNIIRYNIGYNIGKFIES